MISQAVTTLSNFFGRFFLKNEPWKELRSLVEESGCFDKEWYLLENPDVMKAGIDPLYHFCAYGDCEGRSPGPSFNSNAYVESWSDVARTNFGPLEHFLRIGRAAGRPAPEFPDDFLTRSQLRAAIQRSGLFDPDWYREQNADLRDSDIDLLSHLAFYGMKEGRDPGPNFSNLLYVLANFKHIDPSESPLEHFLRAGQARGLEPVGLSKYETWMDLFDRIDAEERDLMRRYAVKSRYPHLNVVHVFDTPACREVDGILDALRGQVHDRWTALIAFAKDVPDCDRLAVAARVGSDSRIRVEPRPGADALASANCGYVLLIHGCVRLTPHATFLFMERAISAQASWVYSDHDRSTKEGRRGDPSFKPMFSPELLRRRFYVGPCVLVRTTPERRDTVLRVIENFRSHGCDELSEALLIASRETVAHVPFALYTLSGDSCDLARRPRLPPFLISSGRRPRVSIVIATRDRIELLRDCLESIERATRYPRDRLEMVVIDNGSVTKEARLYFDELQNRVGHKVVADPGEFNFARLYNLGARASRGDVLIFLNNDMTVIEPRWIELIVDQCLQPDVGVVGAKLLYPDGTIQHAGCQLGVSGVAAHRLVGKRVESVASTDVTRELTAVTGACIGIRRQVFEIVGALDETLRVAFNDVKLCLSCLELGFRNIYISEPLLYHYESKSRGFADTPKKVELQHREAIYTRQRFSDLFQNDPYYSPNLSVERIDELACPPRRLKPWRRPSTDRPMRVMFLSWTYVIGNGVALVIRLQIQRLISEGFEVIVAGPLSQNEFAFEGCRRLDLSTAILAANIASLENVDCVIVHTPPFFSITRYLGRWPMVYFFDHGEPNPEFFEDRLQRESVNWEKRFCAPLAKRIFAISRTTAEQSFQRDVTILRNGNSHMANWSPKWSEPRRTTRAKLGWEDKFVVLNVCRFGPGERRYKGIDRFIEVMEESWFCHPDSRGKIVFALVGKADADDVVEMQSQGLAVFPNVSDEFMIELYAASDLYMNFSKWEGYNLGVGQAMAMGLPVIASDIEAHREFPIITTNIVSVAVGKLHEYFRVAAQGETRRRAITFDWDEPISKLVDSIRGDLRETFQSESGEHAPMKQGAACR